jgi:hypothetical protein
LYNSLSLEFAKTIQGSDLNHRTQIRKEKGLFVPSSSAHWKSSGNPGLPEDGSSVFSKTISFGVSLVPTAHITPEGNSHLRLKNLQSHKIHEECNLTRQVVLKETWQVQPDGPHSTHKPERDLHIPSNDRGFRLSLRIAGRGIMLPDALPPVDTRTFVPSSKYRYVTLTGALQPHHFHPALSLKLPLICIISSQIYWLLGMLSQAKKQPWKLSCIRWWKVMLDERGRDLTHSQDPPAVHLRHAEVPPLSQFPQDSALFSWDVSWPAHNNIQQCQHIPVWLQDAAKALTSISRSFELYYQKAMTI